MNLPLRTCRCLFSCYRSVRVARLSHAHFFTSKYRRILLHNNSQKYSMDPNVGLTVDNPLVQNYLRKLKTEYEVLKLEHAELSNSGNKRLNYHTQIFAILQQITDLQNSLKILDELTPAGVEDKELASIAEEERMGYQENIHTLEAELLRALVPVDPAEECREVVMEVSAGVGGQEAMLFARELFNMYCAYAEYKGWQLQLAELEQSDLGGLRHASVLVDGHQAYQHLRHEAGVHRVQRVPATEKSGRVHTSTVTVATLPQPAEVDVCLKDKDLQIETKRASGAGGQHVNTTDSAVRVTHLPTGMVVECQVDRSQIRNRQMALQRLRAKLYQQQLDQQAAEIAATRKLQVGSSLRSEKIRTYNFNQDRVTDHRLGSTLHNLRGFLSGAEALNCVICSLDDVRRMSQLQQIIAG